jgi:threonine aldolase
MKKGFASDNYAGVHPDILRAMEAANSGHAGAYGNDPYTERAIAKFKELFGSDIEVFFVFNGTAANVLSIKAVTESFNAVICAETAHINVDECGAPENFTGCKLIRIPTKNGKISVEQINRHLYSLGNQHQVQPKVVSITQTTEMGTVYSIEEIKTITDHAHRRGLLVHMDGARIANAVAHLNVDIRQITKDAGVDILSFGGTKSGMMFGEAVVFFNKDLAKNFKFIRKQAMQLASKMRFVSAQFEALLSDDLWLRNARHANKMALLLASKLQDIAQIQITQLIESNAVFATIPSKLIQKLQEKYFFYVWNEETSEVRWMCSLDTEEEDIEDFVRLVKSQLI